MSFSCHQTYLVATVLRRITLHGQLVFEPVPLFLVLCDGHATEPALSKNRRLVSFSHAAYWRWGPERRRISLTISNNTRCQLTYVVSRYRKATKKVVDCCRPTVLQLVLAIEHFDDSSDILRTSSSRLLNSSTLKVFVIPCHIVYNRHTRGCLDSTAHACIQGLISDKAPEGRGRKHRRMRTDRHATNDLRSNSTLSRLPMIPPAMSTRVSSKVALLLLSPGGEETALRFSAAFLIRHEKMTSQSALQSLREIEEKAMTSAPATHSSDSNFLTSSLHRGPIFHA